MEEGNCSTGVPSPATMAARWRSAEAPLGEEKRGIGNARVHVLGIRFLVNSHRAEEPAPTTTTPNSFAPLEVTRVEVVETVDGSQVLEKEQELLKENSVGIEDATSESSESTEWVLATEAKEDNEGEEEVTGPSHAETVEGQLETQQNEISPSPLDGNTLGSPAQTFSPSFIANGSVFVTDRNRNKTSNIASGEAEKGQVQDTGKETETGNPQDTKNKDIEDLADRALQKMMESKGRDRDRPNGKKTARHHSTPSKNKKGKPTTKRGFR